MNIKKKTALYLKELGELYGCISNDYFN